MPEQSAESWRAKFKRSWRIPLFDRVGERVESLSSGDKAIFYILSILVGIATLLSLYALQQKLLVEVPAYGGSLSEGALGSPQFINPLLAISDADRDLSTLVYAGLMGLNGSGELVPVLAESYTISPDGKSYKFVLRENAVFSDGTPVTSEDVIFTIQKAQDPALKSPEFANWAGVRAVAIDKRTVEFTLAKSYAPFLSLTTLGILPSRLWQNISPSEFPFSTLQTSPVGAGPFTVSDIGRNSSGLIKSVSLSANNRYVLGRPYLDNINFTFFSRSEDLSAALKSGSVKSAHDHPLIPTTESTEIVAPYARVFGIFWNQSEKQVFARSEVRKALSLALDRKEITEEVLGGYATAILGPVPPGGDVRQTPVPTSNDTVADAAKILRDGGWTYDGATRAWVLSPSSGAKQTLDKITIRTSNVPELKNVATAAKKSWENLGIAVEIELYEPGDLSQNVIRPRKYEALLYGMVIGRDHDLYAFWDSKEIRDPGLNIALYANKDVDALLESTRNSSNQVLRAQNLQKIEDIVSSDYPAAFMYAPDFVYTVPTDLLGVVLPQIVTPSDRFATVASWYRHTDAVWPFFAK